MLQITVRTGVLAIALLCPACARTAKPSETARVEETRGEMKDTDSLVATVEAVDPTQRLVMMRDDQGRRFAVEASPDALERLSPNDKIEVFYQESVAFALREPSGGTPAEETKVAQSTARSGDGELQFGREISTTVQILSVAPEGRTVEFRVPEGAIRTVAIADGESRDKIANLRPGDSVQVTYRERLALALDEAASSGD